MANLDRFTRAYITAALWSSNDESTPQGGEPMDSNYSIEDIAQPTLDAMIADCEAFQSSFFELFTDENCKYHGCSPVEYAGHDFWLTRNGHGCGFWDGDWVEPIATQLTAACKQYSEINLYIGDDGKVWA
jgi:hypothetical protein